MAIFCNVVTGYGYGQVVTIWGEGVLCENPSGGLKYQPLVGQIRSLAIHRVTSTFKQTSNRRHGPSSTRLFDVSERVNVRVPGFNFKPNTLYLSKYLYPRVAVSEK